MSLYMPKDNKKHDELIPGIIFPNEKKIPPKNILILIFKLISMLDVRIFVNDENTREKSNGIYIILPFTFLIKTGISLNIMPIKI